MLGSSEEVEVCREVAGNLEVINLDPTRINLKITLFFRIIVNRHNRLLNIEQRKALTVK